MTAQLFLVFVSIVAFAPADCKNFCYLSNRLQSYSIISIFDTMFTENENSPISLAELQDTIKQNIGLIRCRVQAEVESHRVSGGHHYLTLIQKSPGGAIVAKASARIWRSSESIVRDFRQATGKDIEAGLTIVVSAYVDYHSVYGLTLIIENIDSGYCIGQRELEKQQTLLRLQREGLVDRQAGLELPFLPFKLAVISSETAAGYDDFCKHLANNPYGYRFPFTLFAAQVQGERAVDSIVDAIKRVCASGEYELAIILRGGGADSDMYCFDEYGLCKAIAESPIPILTAVGHERDFHLADMVAKEHFKTPTAAAGALIDWVADIDEQTERAYDNIRFALSFALKKRENDLSLLENSIMSGNPLNILKQGYVLASDEHGKVIKSAKALHEGEKFNLRFADGQWKSEIKKIL